MLREIRQAIADQVSAQIPWLQCSPYMLGNPTPPSAELSRPATDYDKAMGRGADEWELILTAYVSDVADIAGQARLDTLCEPVGAGSMKTAVESDKTLGGLVDNIRVTTLDGYGRYQIEGRGTVLGARWTLAILTSPGGN